MKAPLVVLGDIPGGPRTEDEGNVGVENGRN